MEQREIYENHYQRIYPLLTAGELDFNQVAKQAGLKERKIRDTLLSRLANDDMIQLFGHKEGICYVCASRMRGNFTKEPLCLQCIETIGKAILELYPPGQPTATSASSSPVPIPMKVVSPNPSLVNPLPGLPPEAMVPKVQFDAVFRELQRYRDKYGPLDSNTDDSYYEPTIEENASTPSQMPSGQAMRDILEADDETEDINYITLSPNDMPKANDTTTPTEPIRHFGFQRLRIRN